MKKHKKKRHVKSRVQFRKEAPDRKHYAMTDKRRTELTSTMSYWTKMTEILENYRETHQSIFRHKSELGRQELSKFFVKLGEALGGKSVDTKSLFPGSIGKKARISPTEPVALKFLYAKENHKLEIHMEIEWTPHQKGRAQSI